MNADGLLDLLVHVETDALQLDAWSTQAYLSGETFSGVSIWGVDAVSPVPAAR